MCVNVACIHVCKRGPGAEESAAAVSTCRRLRFATAAERFLGVSPGRHSHWHGELSFVLPTPLIPPLVPDRLEVWMYMA